LIAEPARPLGAFPADAILTYGISYGNLSGMKTARKITVHVPGDLLDRAQRSTGQGITETVRRGLLLVASGGVYARLRKLRGKVAVSIDLGQLRKDRS
jgi:hypothetical protein